MKIISYKIKGQRKKFYIFNLHIWTKKMRTLSGAEQMKQQTDDISDENALFFQTRHRIQEVLVVKTDGIGDYILFRNFLEKIKQSPKYKNCHLTVILGARAKQAALALDSDIVDKFLWTPGAIWNRDKSYYTNLIQDLFKQGMKKQYDAILFPNIGRHLYDLFHETLIKKVFAKEVISSNGIWYYGNGGCSLTSTRVITHPNGPKVFDFEGMRYFFEQALNIKIPEKLPTIDTSKLVKKYNYSSFGRYVVINPLAEEACRIWHLHNFARLTQWLEKDLKLKVFYVCRSKEKSVVDKILKLSGSKAQVILDLPFDELCAFLKQSSLFIGNASGLFLTSVALKTPNICLTGGMAYARFLNVPANPFTRVMMPAQIKDYQEKYLQRHDIPDFILDISVNFVSFEEVQQAALELLEKQLTPPPPKNN